MKPSVYVETSIVSYLTARPSRDLVRAAHQEVTGEWWAGRDAYDLYISQLVVDEASAGDPDAAALRLQALGGLPLLELTPDGSQPTCENAKICRAAQLIATLDAM
ncbi:hypothetical protein [Sorangium sp. So ce1000]|uniref:hypothetical protein n=1 Tax=Sorangium sp. So ce1000 TaxID=3133325 RepID=UPI003F5F5BFA